jgi:hypothetical protein
LYYDDYRRWFKVATYNSNLAKSTFRSARTQIQAFADLFGLTPEEFVLVYGEMRRKSVGGAPDELLDPSHWVARLSSPWLREPWSHEDGWGNVSGQDGVKNPGHIPTSEEELAGYMLATRIYRPEYLRFEKEELRKWLHPWEGPFYHNDKRPECWRAFLQVVSGVITADNIVNAYRHVREREGVWHACGGH